MRAIDKGEKILSEYEKYFKQDDDGNLLIRTDFIKEIKNIKRNRFSFLLRALFWNKKQDDIIKYIDNVEGIARDVSSTYQARKGFEKPRKEFLETASKTCADCGSTEKLSVDHITPLARGGVNVKENFQVLCIYCNSSKGTK